ncbi:MAG: ABC transporter ATP-binding protein [Colwellia sp.]|nr:ABC transporter ATP-binding protein [Colwellia sp.]
MTTTIQISKLSKSYKKQQVLTELDWSIKQGDVIGLLGKNGAGKSTLINAILNINPADSGSVSLLGEDNKVLTSATKARIGYVPQQNDEITWLTVKELIQFKKQFYAHWNDSKVAELISRWEIDTNKKMSELSVGQGQRVLIILALAHEPDLMIFDEPAAALDPAGRRDFLKEIVNLAADENKTIIFSTHITTDLERVANKVAILHQGKICHFDDLDNVKENVVKVSVISDQPNKITIPYAINTFQDNHQVNGVVTQVDLQWKKELESQGHQVDITPMSLEDIFLELTA